MSKLFLVFVLPVCSLANPNWAKLPDPDYLLRKSKKKRLCYMCRQQPFRGLELRYVRIMFFDCCLLKSDTALCNR